MISDLIIKLNCTLFPLSHPISSTNGQVRQMVVALALCPHFPNDLLCTLPSPAFPSVAGTLLSEARYRNHHSFLFPVCFFFVSVRLFVCLFFCATIELQRDSLFLYLDNVVVPPPFFINQPHFRASFNEQLKKRVKYCRYQQNFSDKELRFYELKAHLRYSIALNKRSYKDKKK